MTSQLITVGESLGMVAIPSAGGGLEYASHGEIRFGGAESNVAICAARLGIRTTWVGRVGNDAIGQRITRTLRGERIDVIEAIDDEAPTAMMLKDHPYPERTRVSYYRLGGAGSRLSPSDLPQERILEAQVLHVTGITLAISESARESIVMAAHLAKEAGVTVSFDVNHRNKLWSKEQATESYHQLAALADIIFAGDDEAEILVGPGSPEELASRLQELGPAQAVIKLGEHGAFAVASKESRWQPAYPVQVVDTVGAGDAFVAGYLAEVITGGSLEKRLETAAACGAYACRGNGDWELMPTRHNIEELLKADHDPVER